MCIFLAASELEWHAHLRGRRFRCTYSRTGAASGGSAPRRRSRWMALRPRLSKYSRRLCTRGRASAHGEPVRRGERLGRTIRGTKRKYLSTRAHTQLTLTVHATYCFVYIIHFASISHSMYHTLRAPPYHRAPPWRPWPRFAFVAAAREGRRVCRLL